MANLPLHPKGTVACGRIHLKVGTESHYFGIEVSGHGPALELRGYLLSEAELHANE